MLKIRLSRTGKKNQPHDRIVVTQRRSKRDGSNVAELGYYIPYSNPAVVKLDTKAYDEWIDKGAQSTEVVSYLRTKAKGDQIVEIPKKPKKKIKKDTTEAAVESAA